MKRCLSAGVLIILWVMLLAGAGWGAAFSLQSDGWHAPSKDPGATLDYGIKWIDWLAGDTIVASVWTYPTGLTPLGDSINGDKNIVTTWLSGGTAGQTYELKNTITTAAGRIQVKRFKLAILQP